MKVYEGMMSGGDLNPGLFLVLIASRLLHLTGNAKAGAGIAVPRPLETHHVGHGPCRIEDRPREGCQRDKTDSLFQPAGNKAVGMAVGTGTDDSNCLKVLCRMHPKEASIFREGVLPLLAGGILHNPMPESLALHAEPFLIQGLTGYDACYAALARDLHGVWLTCDRKPHNRVRRQGISHLLFDGLPKNWPGHPCAKCPQEIGRTARHD
jgi:hypothetical protein